MDSRVQAARDAFEAAVAVRDEVLRRLQRAARWGDAADEVIDLRAALVAVDRCSWELTRVLAEVDAEVRA